LVGLRAIDKIGDFRYSTAHMNLDEKQKEQVAGWLRDGVSLAEVQKLIETEFGVSATYMEVKFLLSDLDLTPRDPEPDEPAEPEMPEAPVAEETPVDVPAEEIPDAPLPPDEPAVPTTDMGNVSVEVDQIARPGSMVSGKVTFSNGKVSEWMLDQMGRLGVVPSEDGYKPTEIDLQQFQTVLQAEIQKMGL
jgi:hypothetical protein